MDPNEPSYGHHWIRKFGWVVLETLEPCREAGHSRARIGRTLVPCLVRGKPAPRPITRAKSDVERRLFFGYFLLARQKKVTAGRARPAGCLPRPEAQPAPQAQESKPTTLAVGLGCDRDTPLSTVEQALQEALQQAGHDAKDIKVLATITAKANEPAFKHLAEKHRLPLRFFSAEALAQVEVPNPSETVLRHMGAPSVSEAAALLAAGTTAQDLLVEKHRLRGPDGRHATVSIAKITQDPQP